MLLTSRRCETAYIISKCGCSSKRKADREKDASVYFAALRATLFLPAIIAVVFTILLYVVLGETGVSEKITVVEGYPGAFGSFTVTLGFVAAVIVWLAVGFFGRRYTAAGSANRLNYTRLREQLDLLSSGIDHSCLQSSGSQTQPTDDTIDRVIHNESCGIALRECNEIEKRLEGRGMPWVTGIQRCSQRLILWLVASVLEPARRVFGRYRR